MAASGAWSAAALADDPTLSKHSRYVEDSGEGCWTINAAIEEAVPADVLSAMRRAIGGHVEPKK